MLDFRSYASSSKGNLYTLSDGETKIMIECGLPWAEIQHKLDFKTSEIDACLLSHQHADHSKAVNKVLMYGIDVYTSEDTISSLKINHHRAHIIHSKKLFQIGSFKVMPFDVPHDVDNMAYVIINKLGERCLFAIDCEYIRYRIEGLCVVAISCNYSQEIIRRNTADDVIENERFRRTVGSHMSLEEVIKFFQVNDRSKLKQVILLHLSNDNSDAEYFKSEVQQITNCDVIVA